MAHPTALGAPGTSTPADRIDAVLTAGAPLEVAIPLAALTLLYAVGWWRLASRRRRAAAARAAVGAVGVGVWADRGSRPEISARSRERRASDRWRPIAGLGAIGCIAIALRSPLAAAAHVLFVAHMVQHLLLIAAAAPLALLADPLPAAMWGLPRLGRRAIGRVLARGGRCRAWWAAVTSIPVAAVVYAVVLWAWHWPRAYDAAVRHEWLHHAEHLAFFGAAVVFWWPVIQPAPRASRPPGPGLRIVHVIAAALHGSLLALLLTLGSRAFYESYASGRDGAPLTPLEDQVWGGIAMWAGGAAVDMLAVMALVWRILADREGPSGLAAGPADEDGVPSRSDVEPG